MVIGVNDNCEAMIDIGAGLDSTGDVAETSVGVVVFLTLIVVPVPISIALTASWIRAVRSIGLVTNVFASIAPLTRLVRSIESIIKWRDRIASSTRLVILIVSFLIVVAVGVLAVADGVEAETFIALANFATNPSIDAWSLSPTLRLSMATATLCRDTPISDIATEILTVSAALAVAIAPDIAVRAALIVAISVVTFSCPLACSPATLSLFAAITKSPRPSAKVSWMPSSCWLDTSTLTT